MEIELINEVQDIINKLEDKTFDLNGFPCKVEKGDLYWDNMPQPLDLKAMDKGELEDLKSDLSRELK